MYSGFQYEINSDGTATIIGYHGSESSLSIPNHIDGHTITGIETNAFAGCDNLRNVVLPESLTTLGLNVFTSPYITSITIPKNVTSMGSGYSYGVSTFTGCHNLETVIFEEGMTKIPDVALYCCESVKNIVIPEGVTIIGNRSFRATGIETLNLPSSLETIEANSIWELSLQLRIETVP